MASWCSSSCSVTSITCRCSVQCHSFQLHNRPLLHLNAFPPTSSSRVAPIRIKLPFHRNNSFKHRNSSGCSRIIVCCTSSDTEMDLKDSLRSPSDIDCVGTGQDVECLIEPDEENGKSVEVESLGISIEGLLEWAVLVSPFFFWGTAMVAMKEVIPKSGPFFVSAFRLVPAGFLLVAFAASRGRPFPSGFNAWLSISLFAVVDAACFQGFLAEGLQRTSAGLGSVIIDSQPLTVAVLAALLFGESIGIVGAAGLLLGVIGLVLLELPALSFDESNFSLWGSGEWWMLLAAQSMAVGTVMVRWVSKYSDPVMATGWHMVIGGLPLLAISILNNDPAISGSFKEFSSTDILALLYTSIFGSAVSYGVFFYSATKGSLTKLSSLTFLTPMFASIFGFLYLGETFSPLQLVGAVVTLAAIYMVNYRNTSK
ncbi:WAT1-related protein At3g02690, chloroplastic-like [Neltuma alba]|uniref:WAT1-related protein At3g02690, chloroplastic-like n=1 Tax=Neltuma alba TaxID=207710 RepID=UPI0010A52B10|nr:WAT1-related protein At3g02690, chloroplastic-like [Prosopis alba]XP_028752760.1 WAT1-related protein At3g02690, chloroplastic-like [Prosopis alba]XP_028800416.1 WAT1-related protein At3g02690, chloroplastic-like [Prosopis alba]